MPKVLEGSARELILNMKKFCDAEKKTKALLIPLKNVRARVAALAGVSEKTVSRIVKEGKIAATTSSRLVTPGKKRPHPKKIVLDNMDLGFIRQKIQQHYVANKEMPSVNKLRLELKNDIDFKGSNTTLRRILKNIGFKLRSPQGKGLTDKPVRRKKPPPQPKEDTNINMQQSYQMPPQQDESNLAALYLRQTPLPAMQMPQPIQSIPNMQNIQPMQSMQNMNNVPTLHTMQTVREVHML